MIDERSENATVLAWAWLSERGKEGVHTPQLAAESRRRRRVQGLPCGMIPFIRKNLALVLAVLACMTVLFSACASGPSKGGRIVLDTVVSTYIRTWPLEPELWVDSAYWSADQVDARYLTDLNIAFAIIDDRDGHTVYIPELVSSGQNFSNLWDEVAALKAKFPHLKVNISVGGWGAEGFSDMADDANLRELFVAGICSWLEQYNLDGVDIDWEYPVGPSWGQQIKSRRADANNYLNMLQDLRDAMDLLGEKTKKRYSLSTAVPASSWFTTTINCMGVARVVDALKLMAYDYYGAWSNTTGHLSNLSRNSSDPNGWSTEQAVNAYLLAGVPPGKIQMGLAFFGRAFAGVEGGPNKDGLFQRYKSLPRFNDEAGYINWPQIKELLEPGSGYTRYWDSKAKAPYLYNGDIWVTYCDPELISELVAYSKQKGLGGFFSWEYGTDINAELLKALAESTTK
jgi:chitinase